MHYKLIISFERSLHILLLYSPEYRSYFFSTSGLTNKPYSESQFHKATISNTCRNRVSRFESARQTYQPLHAPVELKKKRVRVEGEKRMFFAASANQVGWLLALASKSNQSAISTSRLRKWIKIDTVITVEYLDLLQI